MNPRGRTTTGRAGFTLIELLAVLLILSILIALLVTNLAAPREAMKVGTARTKMHQIAAVLDAYSDDHGDFPSSQLPADLAGGNPLNMGSECLYLALCAQGAPGYGVLDKAKDLCNTDEDRMPKRPKGFETQELFELADPWGNPYAYLRASDYDRDARYYCSDETGVPEEWTVKALKNEKTGRFEEPHRFQLLCAGVDGRFGTEDDLAHFKGK